jgi:hypothetical protein
MARFNACATDCKAKGSTPVLLPKGQNMSKTTLIAIAILAISVGYAEAKDRKVETATLGRYVNSKNLPLCTASSSLVEVLGDKCFLVKGSMIYGDIAELSQLMRLGW